MFFESTHFPKSKTGSDLFLELCLRLFEKEGELRFDQLWKMRLTVRKLPITTN